MTGTIRWLASYPKSGNTWFRAVLAAARNQDPFALETGERIASHRVRFDDALGLASSDLTAEEVLVLRPEADLAVEAARDGHEAHFCKIHDALRSGVDDAPVVSVAATRCAVYLVRDPRDVAVSFAHHNDHDVAWAAARICASGTTLSLRDADIVPQLPQRIGDWSSHVLGWVDHAPFPVHVLRYEDCLADPVGAFGAALEFAGFPVDPAVLADAVDRSSFRHLQDREAEHGFAERHGRNSPFFRSGVAGGWRRELAADDAALVERTHTEVMRRFGYLPA